jgi:hypothetical protein
LLGSACVFLFCVAPFLVLLLPGEAVARPAVCEKLQRRK